MTQTFPDDIGSRRAQTLALAAIAGVTLAIFGGAIFLWSKYGTVMFMEMLSAAIWSCF